jgi:hypothetical protein
MFRKYPEASVLMMEKYYCEPCHLLYDQMEYCKICGSLAEKKIKIEVQAQSEKK